MMARKYIANRSSKKSPLTSLFFVGDLRGHLGGAALATGTRFKPKQREDFGSGTLIATVIVRLWCKL